MKFLFQSFSIWFVTFQFDVNNAFDVDALTKLLNGIKVGINEKYFFDMGKLKKNPMVFQKDPFKWREELAFFLFTIFLDKKQKAIELLLNCNKKALFVSENSETGISEIWEVPIKHHRKKSGNVR